MLCRISGSTVGQLGMRPHGTSGILTPRAHACARPRVVGGEVGPLRPYFAHGELTKRIYDAMRTSGTVASLEIAASAMRDKGLDPDNDPVTRTDFVRRVTLQLDYLVRKGKVEKIGRGRAMKWKLAGA